MIEYFLDFFDALGRTDPELAFGVFEALGFDVLHLHNSEVSLLSPLELLIEEVEHGEVEAPHVVTPGEVDVIVRVETGERDRAPEVRIFTLGYRMIVCIQVFLGQTEIDDEDSTVFAIEHKI